MTTVATPVNVPIERPALITMTGRSATRVLQRNDQGGADRHHAEQNAVGDWEGMIVLPVGLREFGCFIS
jgi:hypothetical protein